MRGFDSFPNPYVYNLTNLTVSIEDTNVIIGNYFTVCTKEHIDTSDQTVTKYVSSNLLSFLVYRGQTNMHYLESIPITNIVHHWHYEKKQVWTN
jgi:hypothetical protein